MFDAIKNKWEIPSDVSGRDMTASMNSLLHGKPDAAPWNFVPLEEKRVGHAVSKILNRPELCDDLCANILPWLVVILAMMSAYFPTDESPI